MRHHRTRVAALLAAAWRRALGLIARLFVGTTPFRRRIRLIGWKASFTFHARRPRKWASRGAALDVAALETPDSQPSSARLVVPLSADQILTGVHNVHQRACHQPGFEGVALDDALVWVDEYKHYSFFPLASAVCAIGRARFRRPFSVLELGCGWGGMRVFYEVRGIHAYLGIDINPVAFKESPYIVAAPTHYRCLNLQSPMDLRAKFDIITCFEVLEHIPKQRVDTVLATISRHMNSDSLFLGTASLNSALDVHVLVKEREWWLRRFAGHGMSPDPRSSELESRLGRAHPFNWSLANTSVLCLRRSQRDAVGDSL